MYNCSVVTVSGSTFENNLATSVFTDLPSRVSGGGLSVTIYDNSSSSVIHGRYSYTIQNCTFFNNSANSTVPTPDTTSVLKGGYVNDRGGGVSFYMVHASVVEIKILHCNFTNNNASAFGGGLYMFSPELFTEDFAIADNHFEGNIARNGGGIAIGANYHTNRSVYNMKTDVLTDSVILCSRNTFVRNIAMLGRGGAMTMALVPGEWVVLPHCLEV